MWSNVKELKRNVGLPSFQNLGVLYMHKTDSAKINLPEKFKNYEHVVYHMLSGLCDAGSVYVTIDERKVVNETHRRSGVHVDFNWYETMGHQGHRRHSSSPPAPTPTPVPKEPKKDAEFDQTGGMLLLSNFEGCRGWNGLFNQHLIGHGGSCEAMNLRGLEPFTLQKNAVYYLNPLGIHESLKIEGEVNRSLVRINFNPEYTFS